MNIQLNQKIESGISLQGKLEGIAYSGSIIPVFGFTENFIVDLSTTSIAKEKIPLLRDHNPGLVVGHGFAKIENNQVLVDGNLSKNSSNAMDIINLASDGVDWEMSIGLFDGVMEEVLNTEINGVLYEKANVYKNAVLREISVVALGADKNTSAVIMNQKREETIMKLTEKQYVELACACGGNDKTTPEELAEKVKGQKLITEEQAKKIEDLEAEIAAAKAEIEEKQAVIDAIKAESEAEDREEEIAMAVKEKGIKLSAEKIKEAAKTPESTAMLISFIEDMKAEGKIEKKLTKRVDLGKEEKTTSVEDIRMQAREMVKAGQAKDVLEAIIKLEGK